MGFLGENVVVQRNSPSLVFSTWSFIESQIRVYRKIENTHNDEMHHVTYVMNF